MVRVVGVLAPAPVAVAPVTPPAGLPAWNLKFRKQRPTPPVDSFIPLSLGRNPSPTEVSYWSVLTITPGTEGARSFVAPFDLDVKVLVVNVDTNDYNGPVVFTLRRSPRCNLAFADTALAPITVPPSPGGTGCFESSGVIAYNKGDRISIEVDATGVSNPGEFEASGGLSYRQR